MRKVSLSLSLAAFAVLAVASVAGAALRSPQVPFNSASLQSYLNSVGESINVTTDQQDVQTLRKTVSGNVTFSFMLELAGNGPSNAIGVYNGTAASPTLFQVFPGNATQGWYALASFKSTGNLVVSLFDASDVLQSSTTYTGVDGTNFGLYLQGPAGTFYTQDARNPGSAAQALFFAGTGPNAGQYWLSFEDTAYSSSDTDFNDAVLFLESVTPTPTSTTTWGAVKARWR